MTGGAFCVNSDEILEAQHRACLWVAAFKIMKKNHEIPDIVTPQGCHGNTLTCFLLQQGFFWEIPFWLPGYKSECRHFEVSLF